MTRHPFTSHHAVREHASRIHRIQRRLAWLQWMHDHKDTP